MPLTLTCTDYYSMYFQEEAVTQPRGSVWWKLNLDILFLNLMGSSW